MPQRNFMSHEELSTVIHFAPVSLVVLDRNRNLRRVNKLAEELLGLNPHFCTGSSFLNWVPDSHRIPLSRVLHDAAEAAWAQQTPASLQKPNSSLIMLQTRKSETEAPGRQFFVTVSCSTYFEDSTAPLHEACYILALTPLNVAPQTGDLSPAAAETDEVQQLRRAAKQSLPVSATEDHPQERTCAVDPVAVLLHSAVFNFDFPIICMSKDGRTTARNRAMDELLANVAHGTDIAMAGDTPQWGTSSATQADRDVYVEWLFAHFKLWDPAFEHQLPDSAYPLYRAAIVGERFTHARFGAFTVDGEQHTYECEGWPLYSDEAQGEFVGGMLVLKDVTRSQGRGLLETSLASTARRNTGAEQSPTEDPMKPYWQSVCEELSDMVWIARGDGYLEWYNKKWYEYTGMTIDESVGAGWTSCIHEDDFPVVSQVWSKALRNSAPYEVQERIRGKNGLYRWMLCRAVPFRNSSGKIEKWFGYITDVHATMDTLAANREARDHLSDAVRVADITLWSINPAGIFTLAEGNLSGIDPNASGSSLNGSSLSLPEDAQDDLIRNVPPSQAPIVGKSIYTEWGETTRKAIQRVLAGETVTEENTIKGRTYRTTYKARRARMTAPTSFLLSSSGPEQDAPIIGVTGMSMDITERVDMEQKMAQGIREVARAEAAEAAATEASRMKSQFLAVISHEIRTPLNGVVGLSELLLDIESLPAEAQDLVNSILRSAGALLTVINDVLDFSKVEAGKLDLVSLPFSLKLTCDDAVRDFSRLLAQKGLTLINDIQLPDESVMGDAGRITQVLNNLLGNAGKFTESGAVSLVVRKVIESSGRSLYTFKVSDTGCGIPKQKMGFLFQPFRQADPSTSRRYGGSGLGLAICKNLVQLMGGEITLQSEEGKGTTVLVSIPFQPAVKPLKTPTDEFANYFFGEAPTPATATAQLVTTTITGAGFEGLSLRRSSVVEPTPTTRPRVLLAEDNPINSQIAIKTLIKLGYDVDHVENGELALLAMERQSYDLILMDCMMPCMDGYTATRKMRASSNSRMRTIPIIALTAAAIQGQKMCFAAGMSDYLSKPVRRATLGAMLVKWLGREHVPGTPASSSSPPTPSTPTPLETVDSRGALLTVNKTNTPLP